jgi:hypothetical protein
MTSAGQPREYQEQEWHQDQQWYLRLLQNIIILAKIFKSWKDRMTLNKIHENYGLYTIRHRRNEDILDAFISTGHQIYTVLSEEEEEERGRTELQNRIQHTSLDGREAWGRIKP